MFLNNVPSMMGLYSKKPMCGTGTSSAMYCTDLCNNDTFSFIYYNISGSGEESPTKNRQSLQINMLKQLLLSVCGLKSDMSRYEWTHSSPQPISPPAIVRGV